MGREGPPAVRRQAHGAALPKKEVRRPLLRRPGRSQRSCASPPRAALVGRQRAILTRPPAGAWEPTGEALGGLHASAVTGPELAFLKSQSPEL